MRNASGQQDEKWEAVKKKKEQEHKQQKCFVRKYDIFSMKRVTRKFHGLVVQNNDKELCTKSVLHMQSLVFVLLLVCFFAILIVIAV